MAELGARCVAGNHELLVLGELPEGRAGRLARETTAWTRGMLRQDCWPFLAQLPLVVTADDLVMTHGSLASPEEYVSRKVQAAGRLSRLGAEHPGAHLLVMGHIHHRWLYSQARGTVARGGPGGAALPRPDRFLLNPGSVGQSRQREREPRARCLLVDTDRREVWLYDVAACLQALRSHGLPRDGVHVRPGPLATLERRSRSVLRRSLAAAGLSRRRRRAPRLRAPRYR
jgi:diadenosine tetraphosphatase ApaH/serine/threonine PP2A family protein phosphatase